MKIQIGKALEWSFVSNIFRSWSIDHSLFGGYVKFFFFFVGQILSLGLEARSQCLFYFCAFDRTGRATVQHRIRIVSCFNLHNPHVRTTRRTHPGIEAINPRPINRRGIAFSNTLHCRACSVFFFSFSFFFLNREKNRDRKDIDLDFNLFNLTKNKNFSNFFFRKMIWAKNTNIERLDI